MTEPPPGVWPSAPATLLSVLAVVALMTIPLLLILAGVYTAQGDNGAAAVALLWTLLLIRLLDGKPT